tara:strand:+ start:776 stop:1027 length:252 start_codon:yes stop_codon:yes gene_type:complete
MSSAANDITLLRPKNDDFTDDAAVHGVYIPKGAPKTSAGISDCCEMSLFSQYQPRSNTENTNASTAYFFTQRFIKKLKPRTPA